MNTDLVPVMGILMTFPKLVEVTIYYTLAIIVWSKGRQLKSEGRPQNRPYINILFSKAFLCWAVCTTLDIFEFLFAAVSFDPATATYQEGYDRAHPSLLVANLFRDVGLTLTILALWYHFLAAYAVRNGSVLTRENILRKRWLLAILAGLAVPVIWFDRLSVRIVPGEDPVINLVVDNVAAVFLIVSVFSYLGAGYLLHLAFKRGTRGAGKLLQKKVRYLSWGMLLVFFGYLYAVVLGLLEGIPEIGAAIYPVRLETQVVARAFFTSAAILFFVALKDHIVDDA